MPSSRTKHEIRWITIAVAVMILIGLVGRVRIWPHALTGENAPDFTITRLNGGQYTLSADPARVVILDFWSTSCTPCVVSLPRLEQVHRWAREHNKSVAIYCINLGEHADRIRQMWQKKDLTMPVLVDVGGRVADAYIVNAIPQTVIISDGTVERVHIGTRSTHEKHLKREIEGLLADDRD